MIRDKATGKPRGFAFICYEDQRSTILAVDNLNGIKILGRTLRVDHCEQYKAPNADMSKVDELTAAIRQEGCAPVSLTMEQVAVKQEKELDKKAKKRKIKEKKSKKKKKKRSRSSNSRSNSD
ncbi:hypothetical protein K1T71_005582 [Dendrolimus kikuchii]|uniref:Uncharacterized protein n=1 Tax=Dendrolimus kikuchii TaxID=765133 RepID=A0ACC1D5X0_9NEOP|nr:hypothetical protein K1T71_005582 [Dendrolimus kikuchii]